MVIRKAYDNQARTIWIGNVGDIKPLEYNMQLFLDIAFDTERFTEAGSEKAHLKQWVGDIFGKQHRDTLTDIIWEYYSLALERRPEFMAWSRTYPRTVPASTDFNHSHYNDEAEKRLIRYQQLVKQTLDIRSHIDRDRADAFFQLIYYPVIASAAMNQKFLYLEKSQLYAAQKRASANDYAVLAADAYETIRRETDYYNNKLSNGKWRYMMDMAPRDLSVFSKPLIPEWSVPEGEGWGVVVEGNPKVVHLSNEDLHYSRAVLPAFRPETDRTYFVDVFMTGSESVSWKAKPLQPWIKISQAADTLKSRMGKKEVRLWVSIDWDKLPADTAQKGRIAFELPNQTFHVDIQVAAAQIAEEGSYIEDNGVISIHAENFLKKTGKQTNTDWQVISGLGYTGAAIRSVSLKQRQLAEIQADSDKLAFGGYVEYPVSFSSAGDVKIIVHALPTHPVTDKDGLRLGVALGDGPIMVLSYESQPKSASWDSQVFSNMAARSWQAKILEPGDYRLRLYTLDPEVFVDRIEIETAAIPKRYSVLPETRN